MWHRRAILLGLLASGLSACASKFKTYRGPEVTRIVAQKSQRRLYLLHHDKVLRAYNMGLGHTPQGHKQFEGDGKTPEGVYMIDRRNPNSAFHLSLGISYPNRNDWEYAHAQGKNPGGDIFIHGENGQNPHKIRDWTVGCIAVTDREIEEIYAMVRDGTQIHIVA
ncbi:MAG: L,D-transpeptidase family protein [Paracoccaceae bacterium]